jgi:hypothetical protein
MAESKCGWAGCANAPEVILDQRHLCRIHFYDIASKRLEEHRTRLSKGEPVAAERTKILTFVSEVISETTSLVARAKFLGQDLRDKFMQLTLATGEFYKILQRDPRMPRNIPILLWREGDSDAKQELTSTVNISKHGACISTRRAWNVNEKIRIAIPQSAHHAPGRVAWVRKTGAVEFQIGLEILGCTDFWKLEQQSSKRLSAKRPRSRITHIDP